ncbi:MAG: ABC transporter permease [Ruminococcus sp.]|nr:ABC transporter permease [Ruminococcus sp.]
MLFYLQFKDDSFEYSNNVFDTMIDDLFIMDGRFFTQQEYADGEMKAVVMGSGNEFQMTPSPDYSDTVTVFQNTYEVIGTINPNNSNYYFYSVYVPFSSIPNDTELDDGVYFALNKKITQSEYEAFTTGITNFFGDRVDLIETDMDLKSNNSYYLTVIIIALLIALLSALNISILYNYIIISRKRQLNIMRIYGGINSSLCLSTANEIMLLLIPISVISAFVYDKLILPLLSQKFSLIAQAYSLTVYAEIIAVYAAVSYLLNLALLHKSLPENDWRV